MFRRIGEALLIVVLGLVAYGSSLSFGFLSDDYLILRHFLIRDESVWTLWWPMFVRPLTASTWLADIRLCGPWAPGHHLTNLVLHLIVAAVLYGLARRLYPGSRGAALLSASLFVVLPVHSEAVSWITGRCDVLAALWGTAGYWAYVVYRETGRRRYETVCATIFVLFLFTKESAVAFPLVLAAHDVLARGRGQRPLGRALPWPFLVLTVVYILARGAYLGDPIGGYGQRFHLNFDPGRLFFNVASLPARCLSGTGDVAAWGAAARPILIGAGLCVWLLVVRWWRTIPSACAVLMTVAFLPTVNFGAAPGSPENERLLYWSTVFAALCVSGAIHDAVRGRTLRIAVSAALIGYALTRTWAAQADWAAAARLRDAVLGPVAAASRSSDVVVLNVPDSYRGRYVLRNGLTSAALLAAGRGSGAVEGVMLYAHRRSGDFRATQLDEGVLRLEPETGTSRLIEWPPAQGLPKLGTVIGRGPRKLLFRPERRGDRPLRVFYLDGGRSREIAPGPEGSWPRRPGSDTIR
ncbi:MAG: hypothetical protein MOGMAGMI_01544 [Candidatus Omnitrophica bacterium]|nr:hypothetical protein [Candidatus Omnitrophota bacterium]